MSNFWNQYFGLLYLEFKRQLTQTALAVLLMLLLSTAHAGPREQAKRLHDRIAGIPPSASTLNAMETQIASGDALSAAIIAIENDAFYNVTLKNWITPWTNQEQTPFAPLNDYTATMIGVIRDDMDFRAALYADVIYTGAGNLGLPPYSNANNNHYESLENSGLSLKEALVHSTQSAITGLGSEATSGVITTRAAAKAFFIDGTNRAMFRFTLMNHLCLDLEQVKDATRIPDRIRQDVTRSPGGDSRIFMNNCIACHSGMDPMAQAYAYYEFEHDVDNDPEGISGSLSYNSEGMMDPVTATRVQRKYLINANNFKFGYATPNDNWVNYWRAGPNANLGWDSALAGKGSGAKSMSQELAHSEQFATCQVSKVFKAMCLREPGNATDRAQVTAMVRAFKQHNYNIKQVFAEAAVYCMGE